MLHFQAPPQASSTTAIVAQDPAAASAPPIAPILVSTSNLPADPGVILAARETKKPAKPWLLYAGLGLIALELVAPQSMRPSHVMGHVAASFYAPIMGTSAANTVNLAQQQALAARIADLEGRRAEWIGNCNLTRLLSPDLAQACDVLVEQRFKASVDQARASLGMPPVPAPRR